MRPGHIGPHGAARASAHFSRNNNPSHQCCTSSSQKSIRSAFLPGMGWAIRTPWTAATRLTEPQTCVSRTAARVFTWRSRDTAVFQGGTKQRRQDSRIQQMQQTNAEKKSCQRHVVNFQDGRTVSELQHPAMDEQQQSVTKQLEQGLKRQQQHRAHQLLFLDTTLRRRGRVTSLPGGSRFSLSCTRVDQRYHSTTAEGSCAAAALPRQRQQMARGREEHQQLEPVVDGKVEQQVIRRVYTAVLIVGGGPVGLTFALLLRSLGVPCIVLEKEQEAGCQPKAHYCSNRSMEVWRTIGHVDEELGEATPSLADWRYFSYCTHLVPSVEDQIPHIAARDHFEDHYTYTARDGKTKYFEAFSPCKMCHVPQHIVLPLLYSRLYEAATASPSSSKASVRSRCPSSPSDVVGSKSASEPPGGEKTFATGAPALATPPPSSADSTCAALGGTSSSKCALPLYTRLFNEPLPSPALGLLPSGTRQRLLRLWNNTGSGSSRDSADCTASNSAGYNSDSSTIRKAFNSYTHSSRRPRFGDNRRNDGASPCTSDATIFVSDEGAGAGVPDAAFLPVGQNQLSLGASRQQPHHTTESAGAGSQQCRADPHVSGRPQVGVTTAASTSGGGIQQQTDAAISRVPAEGEHNGFYAVKNQVQALAGTAASQTVAVNKNRLKVPNEDIENSFTEGPLLKSATVAVTSAAYGECRSPAAAAADDGEATTVLESLPRFPQEQQWWSAERDHHQSTEQQTQHHRLTDIELPVPEILFGTEWITGELKEVNQSGEALEDDPPTLSLCRRYNSKGSSSNIDAHHSRIHSPIAPAIPTDMTTSSSLLFHRSPSPPPSCSPPSASSSSSLSCSSFSSPVPCTAVSGEYLGAASSTIDGKPLPRCYVRSLVRHRSKDGVCTPLLIDSAFVFACDGAKSTVAASLKRFSMQGVEDVQHLMNITFSSQHLASLIGSSQYLDEARHTAVNNIRSPPVRVGSGDVDFEDVWLGSRGKDFKVGEDSKSLKDVSHTVQASSHNKPNSICATQRQDWGARGRSCSLRGQGSAHKQHLSSFLEKEGAALEDRSPDDVDSRQHIEMLSCNSTKGNCGAEKKVIAKSSRKTAEGGDLNENRAGDTKYNGHKATEEKKGDVNGKLQDITLPPVAHDLVRSSRAPDPAAASVFTETLAAASSSDIPEKISAPPFSHSSLRAIPSVSTGFSFPTSSAAVEHPPHLARRPSFTHTPPAEIVSTVAAARVPETARSLPRAYIKGLAPGKCTGIVLPGSQALLPAVISSSPLPQHEPHKAEERCASPPSMLYYVMNEQVVGVVVLHSLARGEFVAHVPYFPFISPSCKKSRISTAEQCAAKGDLSWLLKCEVGPTVSSSASVPAASNAPASTITDIRVPSPSMRQDAYPHMCHRDVPFVSSGLVSPSASSTPVFPTAFLSPRAPWSFCSTTSSFRSDSAAPHYVRKDSSLSETGPRFPFSRENAFRLHHHPPAANSSSLLFNTNFCPFEKEDCSNTGLPFLSFSRTTSTENTHETCRETVQHLAGVKLRDLRIYEARAWRMTATVANSFIFPFFPADSTFCTSPTTTEGLPATPPAALPNIISSSHPLVDSSSFLLSPPTSAFPPGVAAEACTPCTSPVAVAPVSPKTSPVNTGITNSDSGCNIRPDSECSYLKEDEEMQLQFARLASVQQQLQQQKRLTRGRQQQIQQHTHTLQAEEFHAQQQRQRTRLESQQQSPQAGTQKTSETGPLAKRASTHSELTISGKDNVEKDDRTTLHTRKTSFQRPVHLREAGNFFPAYATLGSYGSVALRSLPRIVLLGDAAHQLPPAGGLGMNLGIGDAVALAWRIAQLYHRDPALVVGCSSSNDERSSTSREGARITDNSSSNGTREDDRSNSRCGSGNGASKAGDHNNAGRDRNTETITDAVSGSKRQEAREVKPKEDMGHAAAAAACAAQVKMWCRLLRSFDEERKLAALYACTVAMSNFKRGLEIPAVLGLDLRLGEKISDTLLAAADAAGRIPSACIDWLRPDTLERREEVSGGVVAGSCAAAAGAPGAAATKSINAADATPLFPGDSIAATQADSALDRAPSHLFSKMERKLSEAPYGIAKGMLDAALKLAKTQMMLWRTWVPPLWERKKETVARLLRDETKNLGMIYYGVDLAYAYASPTLYVHTPALLAPSLGALPPKASLPAACLSAADEATPGGEDPPREATETDTDVVKNVAWQTAAGGTGRPGRPRAALMVSKSPFSYEPTSWIGCRVPHTWLYCATEESLQFRQQTAYRLSTVDLPFIHYPSCAYCFLVFSRRHIHTLQEALVEAAREKFSLTSVITPHPPPYILSPGDPGGPFPTRYEGTGASPVEISEAAPLSQASWTLPGAAIPSISLSSFAEPPSLPLSTSAGKRLPSTPSDTLARCSSSSSHILASTVAQQQQQQRILQCFAFAVCWEPATCIIEDTDGAPGFCEKVTINRRPFALPGAVAALQLLGSARFAAPVGKGTHAAKSTKATDEFATAAEAIGDGSEGMWSKPDQRTPPQLHRVLRSEESGNQEGRTRGSPRDLEIRLKNDSEMRSSSSWKGIMEESPVDTRFVWSSTKRRSTSLSNQA